MSIKWVSSLDDYAQECSTTSNVLALDPGDPNVLMTWADRLHRLAEVGSSRQSEDAGSVDWVVCLSDGAEPFARHFAAWTNRRFEILENLSELRALLPAPATVTLFATPSTLTVAALRVLAREAEQRGFTYGLMTGASLEKIAYVTAKAVLLPFVTVQGMLSLDYIFGNIDNQPDFSLNRSILSIAAHGEGAHLLLGGAVLCGATEVEQAENAVLPGGCDRGQCKRAQAESIKVSDLKADILALLSCNSFSVAGQLVPTSNSLALGAVAGNAVAVLANPLGTAFTSSSCSSTQDVVASGMPLGQAARNLSRMHPNEFETDSFVLIGDPKCRAVDGPADWVSSSRFADERQRASAPTRHSTLTALDRRLLLTAIETAIVPAGTSQPLALMKQVQSELEAATLFGGAALAKAIEMWGTAFANLIEEVLLDGIVGDGITDAVQRTTVVRNSRLGVACRRCGEPVADLVLESLTGRSFWAFKECPVCGPISLSLNSAPEISVSLPRNFAADQTATFDIFAPSQPAHLVIEVREKAKGRTLLRQRKLIDDSHLEIAIELPDDLTFDQYSIRVIWIAGVEIAYVRSMFFLTPNGVR